jgi:Do/DeqQ family serine protease
MAAPLEGTMQMRKRLVMAGMLLAALWLVPSPAAAQSGSAAKAPDSRAILHALEDAFASVADRVTPSVVNVSVKSKKAPALEGGLPPEGEQRYREFFGPEFYERFFKRRAPREDARAAGSGLIVDARGYILTNAHVVESATDIEVRLSDDRKFAATLVGSDPKTDLAVVKIDPGSSALPPAVLGDSDKLRIGQWAIAIGNPFGLDRTVTVGIISATGRTRVGVATYEAFIQTDASINPGNSGGPLLNIDGRVIGINTAIVSSGQGIGFAIPINMAREVMTQLIAKGRVVRGWLGISIQDLTDELAAGFGVSAKSGVLVADVLKDGPAEAAGMKAGDVIVEMGGAPIKEVTDLQKRVAAIPPGRATALTVLRDRKPTKLTVKIGEQPGEETVVAAGSKGEGLGVTVEGLSEEMAQALGLRGRSGVVVTDVAPGGAAEVAGIKEGDVLLEVNRRRVGSVEDFKQAVTALKPGDAVPVQIERRGAGREYIVLKVPDKP